MTIWMPMLVAGAAALVLSGCAGMSPPPTSSGGSEATMNNVDFACVRRELVSRVVSRGWSVRRNDEVMLLLARPSRRVAAQPVATNVHPPEDRLQFTYTKLDSRSLRVMVQGSVVNNPGSRNEQVTPVQDGPKDQQYAQQTFSAIEKACARRS
jgi:hypothetical protein